MEGNMFTFPENMVEVVRCKDCHQCVDIDGVPYCTHWERNTVADGYCHEGC